MQILGTIEKLEKAWIMMDKKTEIIVWFIKVNKKKKESKKKN